MRTCLAAAECDWVARPPDKWDACLSRTARDRNISLQALERIPDPRPLVTLEVLTPTGHEEIFYLGPHVPRLTAKEVDLLHQVWLQFSEKLPNRGTPPS